jgi:hypothetical protein
MGRGRGRREDEERRWDRATRGKEEYDEDELRMGGEHHKAEAG